MPVVDEEQSKKEIARCCRETGTRQSKCATSYSPSALPFLSRSWSPESDTTNSRNIIPYGCFSLVFGQIALHKWRCSRLLTTSDSHSYTMPHSRWMHTRIYNGNCPKSSSRRRLAADSWHARTHARRSHARTHTHTHTRVPSFIAPKTLEVRRGDKREEEVGQKEGGKI